MHPPEAQAEPQAENAVHDAAAVVAREKVSRETVPDDSRESRVLVVPSPHGDAGEREQSPSRARGSSIVQIDSLHRRFSLSVCECRPESGIRVRPNPETLDFTFLLMEGGGEEGDGRRLTCLYLAFLAAAFPRSLPPPSPDASFLLLLLRLPPPHLSPPYNVCRILRTLFPLLASSPMSRLSRGWRAKTHFGAFLTMHQLGRTLRRVRLFR